MQPVVPPSSSNPLGQPSDAVRHRPAAPEHSAPAKLQREAFALAEVIHRNGSDISHTVEADRLLCRIRGHLEVTTEPSTKHQGEPARACQPLL
ncbi:hypothetical protein AB0J82_27245 [Asanoa sp. NPDC049518]|uniref:hypothetical protein n=1 Tax=unclassified Asanoa TaxID=2685164 RepID=UPI0034474713